MTCKLYMQQREKKPTLPVAIKVNVFILYNHSDTINDKFMSVLPIWSFIFDVY